MLCSDSVCVSKLVFSLRLKSFFCNLGYLKYFLENNQFCKKSGHDSNSRLRLGRDNVIFVITMHCVRKLICNHGNSPLQIIRTFFSIWYHIYYEHGVTDLTATWLFYSSLSFNITKTFRKKSSSRVSNLPLTLSRRRPLSSRNQFIDLRSIPIEITLGVNYNGCYTSVTKMLQVLLFTFSDLALGIVLTFLNHILGVRSSLSCSISLVLTTYAIPFQYHIACVTDM